MWFGAALAKAPAVKFFHLFVFFRRNESIWVRLYEAVGARRFAAVMDNKKESSVGVCVCVCAMFFITVSCVNIFSSDSSWRKEARQKRSRLQFQALGWGPNRGRWLWISVDVSSFYPRAWFWFLASTVTHMHMLMNKGWNMSTTLNSPWWLPFLSLKLC